MKRGLAPGRQRGAALLLAMMIVVLIVTIASGMVWLQTRAVQVEAAERARAQAAWILAGALDWSRLILKEDAREARNRGQNRDSLDEPWATPLAEARLSTFLAADQDNNADSGPEAFISGAIVDAQSRLNLRGLVDGSGKTVSAQVAALQRLADLAGAPGDTAARIAEGLRLAQLPPEEAGAAGAPLRPVQLDDLRWLGIDAATLARLAPWVELLPLATPVNANTAPREVLLAAIDNIDLGTAERLVLARQRKPFETLADVQALLPADAKVEGARIGVSSAWFLVSGRLRLEERVLEERSLLQRDGDRVVVRRRERHSFTAPTQ
ncbi:general secretion pathway protein GspK [beta proteobacterium AAP121]|nr:general secretion pathway protein GspK [beta proteobacterium AAP65]KPF97792.1 general secretion pathway protein GspK [beta proteobacterium AAP121]